MSSRKQKRILPEADSGPIIHLKWEVSVKKLNIFLISPILDV